MSNSSAGPNSKVRAGSSQPSEAALKRKRGVFQKDCRCLHLLHALKNIVYELQRSLTYTSVCICDVTVQHMMYGFGDDPNVSITCKLIFFFNVLISWMKL